MIGFQVIYDVASNGSCNLTFNKGEFLRIWFFPYPAGVNVRDVPFMQASMQLFQKKQLHLVTGSHVRFQGEFQDDAGKYEIVVTARKATVIWQPSVGPHGSVLPGETKTFTYP